MITPLKDSKAGSHIPAHRASGLPLLLLATLLLAFPVFGQAIVFSEIMYYPAGTNVLEEWVEIRNAGPQSATLTGWRLTRGVSFTFPPDTRIPADGHLIVAADAATFRAQHPTVSNVVGGWTGTLSHDGEELRLEDAAGNPVDTVSYSVEGDWAIRRLGPLDRFDCQGWEWFAEHRGLGKSLELINNRLPNDHGQNWGSSIVLGGTPGQPNSIERTDVAPILLDVAHHPVVPGSSHSVSVTVRLLDERTENLQAILHWRLDGAASFASTPMLDDGAHGDGVAADGRFGAMLPPQPQGTRVEFYLTARDTSGQSRTYPNVEPSAGPRTANLIYEVDDTLPEGDQPMFRLLMTQAEYDYLSNRIWRGEPNSDATVSGTVIHTDGVLEGGVATQWRHFCDFRNRGHGTRTANPHNFHVGFPKDNPWKGRAGLHLNTHYTHSQQIGSAVFRRAGIPMPDSRPVQVRVNGVQLAKPGQEQFGSYAANEPMDERFVQRQFPLDDQGNLYRGVRDMIPGIDSDADLAWKGPDFTSYTNAYTKETHAFRNDWSDFLQLLDVLNHAPDATYANDVRAIADVDQWMKYFAVNTLLGNQENSLGTGEGDDFALYRGTRDVRFVLLPYDMDSVLGRGSRTASHADGLWRMTNVTVLDRFMKHPEFAPRYFRHLTHLAAGIFSPENMNPLLDQLTSSYVDATAVANMKAYNSNHVAHVLSQFPHALTVRHDLPVSWGLPHATAPTADLRGDGDPAKTAGIQVNGQPAAWSAWQGAWSLQGVGLHPGLNRLTIRALGFDGSEVGRLILEVWYDDGSVATSPSRIATDTTWTAAGGPYQIEGGLTIATGATLTLEPGTTVYLGPGADLVVEDGGRLVAEGTPTNVIRFASAPGSTGSWDRLRLNGSIGSPETRLIHVHFEGNGSTCIDSSGGTLVLDHATFGTTSRPYLSLDESSFVVSHCHFPTTTGSFEPLHGNGGIKPGGRGIFHHNFFGSSSGYSDIIDFTGGNRPNQPILQFYRNVFTGSTDDILDLDGTDAWIQGNIFLHVHRNGAPDSSAAVSGGSSGGATSEITLLGNLFFDCDNAVTAKQGNFYTLLHNTIVRTTRIGGEDFDSGVVNLRDTTPDITSFGRGAYLEGNIVVDTEKLVRNDDPSGSATTWIHNILPIPWMGSGRDNLVLEPLLVHIPSVAEASFDTWEEAQVMREWLRPGPGSPAYQAGALGRDLGGVIAPGAWVAGEPPSITRDTTATLHVGILRSEDGIPSSGFPLGSGFTHYRWRLDEGEWSDAVPGATPISLSQLADGPHSVAVIGVNDAGTYQNDPHLGPDATVTLSRTWTVDHQYLPPAPVPTVRIHEILARNTSRPTPDGTTPDLIELHNFGSEPVDLSGMGLTDNAQQPYKYRLPVGAWLEPGAFLTLQADNTTDLAPLHTGFALKQEGDDLSLFDTPARGGNLLDAVRFGLQIADLSIGRLADGSWGLCLPTFGASNAPHPTGDPYRVRINEWLADAQFIGRNDFIELFNPESLPVAIGGWFLSDAAGSPARHAIPALSYLPAKGHAEFIADGDPGQGASHLAFRLSPDMGIIRLSDAALETVDVVNYGPQRTDISQGRSPDGASTLMSFPVPTPGGGNPGTTVGECTVVSTTIPLLGMGAFWKYNQTSNLDGTGWQNAGYDDSSWPSGAALLGVEDSSLPAPGRQTLLTLGRTTYYFRTHFLVDTNLDGFSLHLTMVVDDGAVLYLNGQSLWTNGMANGTPAYATPAARNVGNATTEILVVPNAGTTLIHGTNILAAEVHQASSGSSDFVWGLAVEATRTTTHCLPGTLPTLVLNEVLAAPDPGSANPAASVDFIEIANFGTESVDLSEMTLTEDAAIPAKWAFPAGSQIRAGEHRVVACNATLPASPTNSGFALSSHGGAVFLFHRPSAGAGLIDAIPFGVQTPGFAIARLPSGIGSWNLAVPSPAAANVAAPLADMSQLRINEWMADPVDGPDWFELFNGADQPVALAGLSLTDDFSNPAHSPIAPLSFIGSGIHGFRQFFADGDPVAGGDHVSFALKRSGEALGLFSPSGTMIDGLTFGPQATGVSEGRFPDGATTFATFSPTPGLPNGSGPVDSDHDGMTDTWEITHFQTLSRDGSGDWDLDGASDLAEFVAATNPTQAGDVLRFHSITVGTSTTLEFHAIAGRSYSVQSRMALGTGAWTTMRTLPPQALSGPVSVTDPIAIQGTRFYRIVTPAE